MLEGDYRQGKVNWHLSKKSPIVSTTPLIYNDQMEPRRISDVEVPHFTKSKHFTTANNRRSVLSLYYAKDSIKDLNEFLIKGRSDLPPQGSTDNESRSEDPEIAEYH
ncbi:ATV_HP_G0103520.mRNA.1.CDS.1 [Saccharomyces cerevisiae]|nr:ATV_HP_G0103520.mRNA.1.CDS.1 [Saccharomyces cerevisiae]CAI6618504.1 ATV_HP_G0103520.mRNA.1.CDS.1 [Saccharomyces cerevisiae]